MTRTALVGWELGMGLWHAAALREVALALRARGYRVVLALADPVGPWSLLRDDGFVALQAPRCPPRPTAIDALATPAVSFADILAGAGFARVAELRPLVGAWRGLLELARADLVVCDHAPTLQLACYGRVPVVELGLAFTMPPTQLARFPALREAAGGATEEDLGAVIAAVQRDLGEPAPTSVPGLFAAAERFICTFPELDPYARYGPRPYAGTLGGWCAPLSPPARPRFFAYLAAEHERIGSLITGLVRSGVPGAFYLRGAPEEMRLTLRRQGVTVYDHPVALADELARASVVVHHGGAGLTQHAASAGRPQLAIPRHLEQHYNATALALLGVGEVLHGGLEPLTVGRSLRRLAHEPEPAAAAQRWAATIAARGHDDPVGAIVAACERLAPA